MAEKKFHFTDSKDDFEFKKVKEWKNGIPEDVMDELEKGALRSGNSKKERDQMERLLGSLKKFPPTSAILDDPERDISDGNLRYVHPLDHSSIEVVYNLSTKSYTINLKKPEK